MRNPPYAITIFRPLARLEKADSVNAKGTVAADLALKGHALVSDSLYA